MRSVNKVTLLGHVGQEPKIISTPGGGVLANLSLATSYRKGGKDGQKVEEVTEWHRLVAFGRTAEIVRDYVGKGAKLYIEGQLQTRSWDKDGEKRYSTEIVVREFSMLDSRAGKHEDPEVRAAKKNAALDETEITDDDIPF